MIRRNENNKEFDDEDKAKEPNKALDKAQDKSADTASTDANSELDTETIAKTLSASAPAALKNTYNIESEQNATIVASVASDNVDNVSSKDPSALL